MIYTLNPKAINFNYIRRSLNPKPSDNNNLETLTFAFQQKWQILKNQVRLQADQTYLKYRKMRPMMSHLNIHFYCIMSGRSGSEKTPRLYGLLQLEDVICNDKFFKIHYLYSTWQDFTMKESYENLLIISSKVYLLMKSRCQWLITMRIRVILLHFLTNSCWFLMICCDIVPRRDNLMQKYSQYVLITRN